MLVRKQSKPQNRQATVTHMNTFIRLAFWCLSRQTKSFTNIVKLQVIKMTSCYCTQTTVNQVNEGVKVEHKRNNEK